MIPSYFKIKILTIQDEFVLLGHKGLNDKNQLKTERVPYIDTV